MGRDPKTSVPNAHNQAHDVKNLFVTDGACMALRRRYVRDAGYFNAALDLAANSKATA